MDSTRLFRKVALDRLSSPEQLDQLLRVTTPKSWLALVALIALVCVAVVWGYVGQVTTKVSGEGVLIRSGGVQSVSALGAGRVIDLKVKVGDHIAVNQVIGSVAQPSLLERIRVAKGQLADAIQQKDDVLKMRTDRIRLELAFLKRHRTNLEREIEELQREAKLVEEQIPVDEELLAKGLTTKQQTYLTKQKLVSIQGSMAAKRAEISQLDASEFQTENENMEANIQFQNKIMDLRREVEVLEKELENQSTLSTPYAGQVLEMKVSPGSLVQLGTPILSLHPDIEKLEAMIYVPAEKAKEIRPGMEAEISPTTVRREEFGFIRGKVSFVFDYPATEAALMRVFENAPLVRSLSSGGPVTEVRVEMETDPSTPTGYRWSSSHGAPIKLSGGTIFLGEIVTRTQRPVSLVFPYVKEKLGLR
jgi:HlyD family secretion protein